jgi:hypothetical protein
MRALTCLLIFGLLRLPSFGAGEGRWFRGVESVNRPAAGIDESMTLRVRDLDGWLLTEIERRNLADEKHFKNNELELFIAQRKEASSVGKQYGDLMQDEQERLDREFEKLAWQRRQRVTPKPALTPPPEPASVAPGATAAPSPPAPAPPAISPAQEAANLARAQAKAEADLEIWFAKWQAFQAYQRFFHEVKENLYLVLNNRKLRHVKARNPFDAGHNENSITILALEFVLKQHPADKAEWDALYDGTTRFAPASVTVGCDLEGKSFVLDTEVQPAAANTAAPPEGGAATQHRGFALMTYGMGSMISGLGLVAVAFLAFLYLASRTELVRDPEQAPRPDGLFPFSLSRCQMAFWFFLFAAAYIFLWVVKRQTDTLTDQCLVLLGISTGTTLGAAVLAKTANQAPLEAGSTPREPPATYLKRSKVQRFFEDILSDRNQITFHRFQMAVWTLIMGLVFVRSVCSDLQMPHFGTNELTLMGISAGTYIGFKIPATSKSPPPPAAPPPATDPAVAGTA